MQGNREQGTGKRAIQEECEARHGGTPPAEKFISLQKSSFRTFTSAFCDLLRGLFSLPTHDAPPQCDYAQTLEERYSKPRRCC